MRDEEWTRWRIVGDSRGLLERNRRRSRGHGERGKRNCARVHGLTPKFRPAGRAQHRREFSALRLPKRHADGLAGSSPPIFSDLRDSTKNITPTAIIVIESSIGSVRNPSAITGESASRNCSVE